MRPRGIVLGLVLLVIVPPFAFAAYALLARYVLHGPVDASSLSVSVSSHAGTLFDDLGRCAPEPGPRVWECDVSLGSDGATYRVRVREGSSCWDARRTGANGQGHELPRRMDGCVHRWQWSLL